MCAARSWTSLSQWGETSNGGPSRPLPDVDDGVDDGDDGDGDDGDGDDGVDDDDDDDGDDDDGDDDDDDGDNE